MINCNNTKIYISKDTKSEVDGVPSGLVELTSVLSGYGTVRISGLMRPKADVNRTASAVSNTSFVDSVRVFERNITFDIVPQGDGEEVRQALYSILPFAQPIRLYVVTPRRSVYIDGYVEELGGDIDEPNGDELVVPVSIICPYPWFRSTVKRELKLKAGKTIIPYDGDIPAGFELQVTTDTEPVPRIGNLTICTNDYSDPRDPFKYIGKVEVPLIRTVQGDRTFISYANIRHGGGMTVLYQPQYKTLAPDSRWVQIMPNSGRGYKDAFIKIECDSEDIPNFEKYNKLRFRDTYSGI